MDIKTYESMRIWENIVTINRQLKQEIELFQSGEKELDFEDTVLNNIENVEDKIDQIKKEIETHKKEQSRIEKELATKGIDVEYIVTGAYTNLKRGAWLHNYYIEENKIEHGDYYYKTYEQVQTKDMEREAYKTLDEAVSNIMSFYSYMSNETNEKALKRFWENWG